MVNQSGGEKFARLCSTLIARRRAILRNNTAAAACMLAAAMSTIENRCVYARVCVYMRRCHESLSREREVDQSRARALRCLFADT